MKRSPFVISLIGILGFVALMGTTSCRKYEDGPTLSFLSREARVVNDWVAEDITRNDIREFTKFESYSMNFTEGGRATWTYKRVGEPEVSVAADWELATVDEEIKLTFDTPDPVSGQKRLLYMEIRRLTDDEMWLSYLTDGDYFDVKLK